MQCLWVNGSQKFQCYMTAYHDDPCTWMTCETAVYSTVWVTIYPVTQCNISEDLNLQNLIRVLLHVHILYLTSHSLTQAIIISCLKYLPALSQLVSVKLTIHYVLFLYFIQWVTWSHLVPYWMASLLTHLLHSTYNADTLPTFVSFKQFSQIFVSSL